MKCRVSPKIWPIAWTALITAAIAVGIFVRASYTDYSNNYPAFSSLPYNVAPYSTDESQKFAEGYELSTVDDLLNKADLVAEVTALPNKQIAHKALLTEVDVTRVIKGPAGLNKTNLKIYEPVEINHLTGEKLLMPQDAYMLGGIPMQPGKTYTLFLAKTSGEDTYSLLSSPYAKTPKDVPVFKVLEADNLPSLADVEQYDLVVDSDASSKTYLEFWQRIQELTPQSS